MCCSRDSSVRLFLFADPLADAEGLSRFEIQVEGYQEAPAPRAQLLVVGNTMQTTLKESIKSVL